MQTVTCRARSVSRREASVKKGAHSKQIPGSLLQRENLASLRPRGRSSLRVAVSRHQLDVVRRERRLALARVVRGDPNGQLALVLVHRPGDDARQRDRNHPVKARVRVEVGWTANGVGEGKVFGQDVLRNGRLRALVLRVLERKERDAILDL